MEDLKKKGKEPQALKDRPVITDRILPYYRGWNLLDARRQHNETGHLPLPLTDIEVAAKLFMDDDPDEIYEFCMIITTVEAWLLRELAAERKRAIDREKLKARLG